MAEDEPVAKAASPTTPRKRANIVQRPLEEAERAAAVAKMSQASAGSGRGVVPGALLQRHGLTVVVVLWFAMLAWLVYKVVGVLSGDDHDHVVTRDEALATAAKRGFTLPSS